MNINLSGETAIIFARFWGIVTILFGLFITFIAIYDVSDGKISVEEIIIKILLFPFAIGCIFLGHFFLTMKMSSPNEGK